MDRRSAPTMTHSSSLTEHLLTLRNPLSRPVRTLALPRPPSTFTDSTTLSPSLLPTLVQMLRPVDGSTSRCLRPRPCTGTSLQTLPCLPTGRCSTTRATTVAFPALPASSPSPPGHHPLRLSQPWSTRTSLAPSLTNTSRSAQALVTSALTASSSVPLVTTLAARAATASNVNIGQASSVLCRHPPPFANPLLSPWFSLTLVRPAASSSTLTRLPTQCELPWADAALLPSST
mmetsp:Transcript_15681/g.49088  ORF Transcript_15681/g.49088 Transcript_15681/m.49088 type:complete len:232 (-) Transcript_15681:2712-3407(-)